MNVTISLDNILHSLGFLSSNNKRWLAEHLIEQAAKDDAEVAAAKLTDETQQTSIKPEDLEITPLVASIGQNIKPLPKDFDFDKEKADYLMQKYG